jgi:Zn-dependent protease
MVRASRTVASRAPISIGRGGLVPVALFAGLFAALASSIQLPIGVAALLGGIGGTASLLVHEFGHVRAARRLAGIRSAGISLIWLGAATRFEGKYANGREQARVAIAGPQASFAFALALVALCFVPSAPMVRDMLLALALFNVLLGILNLVPAYPLDGHKLVVGLLWSLTGSESKARRILRRIGLGWAACEFPMAAFLLLEKPHLGVLAVVMGLSLLAQKRFARKPLPSSDHARS